MAFRCRILKTGSYNNYPGDVEVEDEQNRRWQMEREDAERDKQQREAKERERKKQTVLEFFQGKRKDFVFSVDDYPQFPWRKKDAMSNLIRPASDYGIVDASEMQEWAKTPLQFYYVFQIDSVRYRANVYVDDTVVVKTHLYSLKIGERRGLAEKLVRAVRLSRTGDMERLKDKFNGLPWHDEETLGKMLGEKGIRILHTRFLKKSDIHDHRFFRISLDDTVWDLRVEYYSGSEEASSVYAQKLYTEKEKKRIAGVFEWLRVDVQSSEKVPAHGEFCNLCWMKKDIVKELFLTVGATANQVSSTWEFTTYSVAKDGYEWSVQVKDDYRIGYAESLSASLVVQGEASMASRCGSIANTRGLPSTRYERRLDAGLWPFGKKKSQGGANDEEPDAAWEQEQKEKEKKEKEEKEKQDRQAAEEREKHMADRAHVGKFLQNLMTDNEKMPDEYNSLPWRSESNMKQLFVENGATIKRVGYGGYSGMGVWTYEVWLQGSLWHLHAFTDHGRVEGVRTERIYTEEELKMIKAMLPWMHENVGPQIGLGINTKLPKEFYDLPWAKSGLIIAIFSDAGATAKESESYYESTQFRVTWEGKTWIVGARYRAFTTTDLWAYLKTT